MPWYFKFEVERTVTYRRTVVVRLDETPDRLRVDAAEINRTPVIKGALWNTSALMDEAHDLALEKAKVLTGWEPSAPVVYHAVQGLPVDQIHHVDVVA